MSFVRFPARLEKDEDIKKLLMEIQNVMSSKDYKQVVEISKQKSTELATLKHNRDQARKDLRKGRSDTKHGINSPLAAAFKAGTLLHEVNRLEEKFGYRKHISTAELIRPP